MAPPSEEEQVASSPQSCAICLERITPETASKFIPCNHQFDLECAATLLKGFDEGNRQCTLCRTQIKEVRFNFQPGGAYNSHIPDTNDENSGPFLPDDERLLPDMSEEERSRRIELRRMRRMEGYDPLEWQFAWMGTWAKEEEMFHLLSRTLAVKVMQASQNGSILTTCTLIRKLVFGLASDLPPGTGKAQPNEIEKAKAEVEKFLDSFGIKKRPFRELRFDEAQKIVCCDKKGMSAAADKSTIITKLKKGINLLPCYQGRYPWLICLINLFLHASLSS